MQGDQNRIFGNYTKHLKTQNKEQWSLSVKLLPYHHSTAHISVFRTPWTLFYMLQIILSFFFEENGKTQFNDNFFIKTNMALTVVSCFVFINNKQLMYHVVKTANSFILPRDINLVFLFRVKYVSCRQSAVFLFVSFFIFIRFGFCTFDWNLLSAIYHSFPSLLLLELFIIPELCFY